MTAVLPKEPIAFVDLKAQRHRLGARIDQAITRVVDHGGFIMGPEVKELEGKLARFVGAKHCVSCANGTDALALVLKAHGIGPGDLVFVPAFTFVATAEPVCWLGATPVFVDVIEDSFNMDPASLEAAIVAAKAGPGRPRAVIAVDLFGQPADYHALQRVADSHGLFLLADAAQSFGASLDNRRVGTFGPATTTSFFPAKPFGCYGDGGAVFTEDDGLADLLRSLRVHGQGREKYDNVRIGVNSRLDTIQAAVLLEKLTIFEDEIERRQRVAQRYDAALAGVAVVPRLMRGATSVWAQYTLRVKDRDRVQEICKKAGVPTAIYYPIPLSQQTGYRHFPTAPGGVPVSERLSQEVVSLPMHPYLGPETQDNIIDAVRSALG
jgi:UDP-2-acetamido-2-deoxy-ribo-hexuluronate aminotransferase